jgi:hypothetical protein
MGSSGCLFVSHRLRPARRRGKRRGATRDDGGRLKEERRPRRLLVWVWAAVGLSISSSRTTTLSQAGWRPPARCSACGGAFRMRPLVVCEAPPERAVARAAAIPCVRDGSSTKLASSRGGCSASGAFEGRRTRHPHGGRTREKVPRPLPRPALAHARRSPIRVQKSLREYPRLAPARGHAVRCDHGHDLANARGDECFVGAR